MTDVPGFPFPFDLGAVAKDMQKRFGWNEQDLGATMAQLMPAAMSGARHFGPMVPGFQGLLPNAGSAFQMPSFLSPQNTPAMDDHLMPFFGPAFVRKAVAEQVASVTGLQQEAITEMMPVAATLAMGQLARPYLQGQPLELLDAFLRGFARGRPKPAPGPSDYIQGYTQAMQAFWSGFMKPAGAGEPQPEPEEAEPEDEPEELDEMPENEAAGETSEFETMMADWMTAGRDFQSTQFKAFDSLFEKAVRDMNSSPSKTS